MTGYMAIVSSGTGPASLTEVGEEALGEGDVLVDVTCSSLNYKDGLAVTGTARMARSFPMVCGVDLAGRVIESSSRDWSPGEEAIVTGWGLSETHPGGYTSRQRVKSEWLVRPPSTLSLSQTMAVGTAGLTAMLCVLALERAGLSPDDPGEVLVTGAGGGVGGVAVALLASMGYQVAASTGRAELHDYLRSLGATTLVDRQELSEPSGRPLDKERWAGAVDTVGSHTLATVLRQTRYGGSVASCGLAGGNDLPTTVLPFILRGVSLLGIDSVYCPMPVRVEAWNRIGSELPLDLLDSMTRVEPLTSVPRLATEILDGKVRGRVVIDTQHE